MSSCEIDDNKRNKTILLPYSFFLFLSGSVFAQNFKDIKRYKVNFALAAKGNEKLISIRSFVSGNQKYLLLVNPQTLNTKIDLANKYVTSNLSIGNVQSIFKKSVYIKAMELALKSDRQLQNAGIDHAIPKEKGVALTIDLCPSHKNLDRIIFLSLINEFKKVEQPVP
ncbi:MAG: polysaccharide deacetylase, partial [Flavobacterium sp.]